MRRYRCHQGSAPRDATDHTRRRPTNCLTGRVWWYLLAIGVSFAALWVGFAVFLAIVRPDRTTLTVTARLLPDTVRLIKRLATDRTIPLRTRLPVWFLIAYLVSPIDLIPDFIPVIGYADDVIITSFVRFRCRHCKRVPLWIGHQLDHTGQSRWTYFRRSFQRWSSIRRPHRSRVDRATSRQLRDPLRVQPAVHDPTRA